MPPQTFNVAVVPAGGVQIAVVHIDAASCSTPELQKRSMQFFQARLEGKHVALMYVDLMRKPVYLGASHVVAILRGKGLNDLPWQKVVFN
jgi:hypothetical protein